MTIFRISICGCFSFHQLLRHLEKDVHVPLAPWILPRYCPAKNRAKRHLPKWEVHWWVCLYSHIHPVWDIFFDVLWCFFEPWNFCFSITVVLWRIGMDFSDGKYLKVVPRFQITTLNQWTMITRRPQTTFKSEVDSPLSVPVARSQNLTRTCNSKFSWQGLILPLRDAASESWRVVVRGPALPHPNFFKNVPPGNYLPPLPWLPPLEQNGPVHEVQSKAGTPAPREGQFQFHSKLFAAQLLQFFFLRSLEWRSSALPKVAKNNCSRGISLNQLQLKKQGNSAHWSQKAGWPNKVIRNLILFGYDSLQSASMKLADTALQVMIRVGRKDFVCTISLFWTAGFQDNKVHDFIWNDVTIFPRIRGK